MSTLHIFPTVPLLAVSVCALAMPLGAQSGTVTSAQKISDSVGGFGGILDDYDAFGTSVVGIGDLDGDFIGDAVIGVDGDDDGLLDAGGAWVLFLASNGTVKSEQKISSVAGGFRGTLYAGDRFGSALAALGDFSGNGIFDIAVGARGDDGIGIDRGAVWLLALNGDGTVAAEREIGDRVGGLGGVLHNGDFFGASIAFLGDLNGDGVGDLAVGAPGDEDGGLNCGAVWILNLDTAGLVISKTKISATRSNFNGHLDDNDRFGSSLASVGDLDGDGVVDIAVGANGDDDGGTDRGALWILFLKADGTVKTEQKISSLAGGFGGALDDYDSFGTAVATLGDHDGDTTVDLIIGAPADGDGGPLHGALWVLFLDPDGTVRDQQKISETDGGFEGSLNDAGFFGSSIGFLGDHNGDGMGDVACGAHLDNDGGVMRGAVWVIFLNGAPPASATPRNGSHINPMALTSITRPVLGQTWIVEIECAGHDPSVCAVMGGDSPITGPILGIGELLVDFINGAQYFFTIVPHSSSVVTLQYPLPLDTIFAGIPVYTQGLVLGDPGANLTNGIDLLLGK